MTSGISIDWSPELEAQFQEHEKAHHEAGVREMQEMLGLPDEPLTTTSGANAGDSPLEQPVSLVKGHNPMGRPPKALDPAILRGPGSLRVKGRALGVSPMTVMRRLRKEG